MYPRTNITGTEVGQTIRYPATANLMVDSADKTTGTSGNFTISKANSLFNGFFSRIGTTEIVLNWNRPNLFDVKFATIDISGLGVKQVAFPPGGIYTCESAIKTWIALINANPATFGSIVLSVASYGNFCTITGTIPFRLIISSVPTLMNFPFSGAYSLTQTAQIINTINDVYGYLTEYKYLDFVSAQLTYNQDLKDASTAKLVRDVLCRFYLASDSDDVLQVDGLGYPVEYTYQPFNRRRIFNPPKQIAWQNNMPIGQLSFEVWGVRTGGTSELLGDEFDWQMTLQVSEN